MESLCNYVSDDDNSSSPRREVATKLTRANGMEADANYEQVTMDMSEILLKRPAIQYDYTSRPG